MWLTNNTMKNSISKTSNTTYKGIHFRKELGTFQVTIQCRVHPGQKNRLYNIHIGNFDNLRDAIKVREDFITSLY